jgi:nucleotide-binding universal stress UspA family protein
MGGLIKKILIATDGSSCSRKAANYGIDLAKVLGAQLLVVYVVDITSLCTVDQCISTRTPEVEARTLLMGRGESATRFVGDLAAREGLHVERFIREGRPAEEIIKLATEQNVDLIVMGSLGLTGLKKYLLCSTADKVVRHSRVPVMIVRK